MKKWKPVFVGLIVATRLMGFDLAATAYAQPSLSAAPAAALGTPASAGAQEEPAPAAPTSSNYRVHRGFYLAAQLGGGYLSLASKSEGGSATITGGGVSVLASVGASLIENLVIHGDFTSNFASKPTMKYNESESVRSADTRARLLGFGGGATYFIMPLNIYVGGSVLVSQVSIDFEGETIAATNLGIGGALRAGKQFWIGESWGLDLGTLFHVASMPEKDGRGQVSGFSLNVLAGISLN